MDIKVIYFAAVRELVGVDEEDISWDPKNATVAQLVSFLERRHTKLKMEGVRVAINEEFADESQTIESGDTIALIPPVSGG